MLTIHFAPGEKPADDQPPAEAKVQPPAPDLRIAVISCR